MIHKSLDSLWYSSALLVLLSSASSVNNFTASADQPSVAHWLAIMMANITRQCRIKVVVICSPGHECFCLLFRNMGPKSWK